jgi:predicted TPR repeat methyltransferase
LQLAGTLFDAGDGQGASQAGVDALRVAGSDAGLCFRIGSVLEQCADPVAASAAYEAALQADPARPRSSRHSILTIGSVWRG